MKARQLKLSLLKPPALQPGDTLAIIAPASAPPDPKAIDRCVAAVEALGFKPLLGPNAAKRHGFLAGHDRERAGDLMTAFTKARVRGIICVRGGYGAGRLLPLLDYGTIRENPKVLVGYSDITSLHCALLVKAGLVSFHGPMLNSDFIQPEMPPAARESFLRTLCSTAPAGSICAGFQRVKKAADCAPDTIQPITLRGGKASGRLVGGNITLLCTTLGTPYQPRLKNQILFFEDLEEVPYRFDRMLTHLLNAGALDGVAGIAIGINKDCEDPKAKDAKEYRQTMEDVFLERLAPLKVPIVSGLPFGHVPQNATLPIGTRAVLDGAKQDLVLVEPAVT